MTTLNHTRPPRLEETPSSPLTIVPLASSSKEDAFIKEVLSYQPLLLRLARRLTRHCSSFEPDDLVQETLLKAFRFRHTFIAGTHLQAWLFRIMYTTQFNMYKHDERAPLLDSLSESDDAFPLIEAAKDIFGRDGGPDPEREYLDRLYEEDIHQALQLLLPTMRKALLLCYVDGYKYTEIATLLHVPIGTVMSSISRGKQHLRSLLAHYDLGAKSASQQQASEWGCKGFSHS